MKYMLSGLVGFLMTLALSIPLQHIVRTREAQALSMRARTQQAQDEADGQADIFVRVPPMAPLVSSTKEPKVKFLPQYPAEAAAQRIEGYVTLSFQIADDGGVKDLKVIESQPPAVFDRAARRAVSRWNFGAQDRVDSAEHRLRLVFNLKNPLVRFKNPKAFSGLGFSR